MDSVHDAVATSPRDPAAWPVSDLADWPEAATGPDPAEGLVTCATTGRVSETAGEPAKTTGGRRFPTRDLVTAAAGLFDRRESWGGAVAPVPGAAALAGLRPATGRRRRVGEEGPRPVLSIAPGVLAVSWPDVARRERTAERGQEADRKAVDQLAHEYNRLGGQFAPDPEPTRVITEWSAKSRARMTRLLAELDYGPLLRLALRLPMTTLTYPGDWLLVAPTGAAVKAHLKAFRKRFERAWGFPPMGIWKLEFQRRGAPHIHLWGPEPEGTAGELRRLTQRRYRPAVGDGLPYREWLSAVWTDIVFTDAEAAVTKAAADAGTDREKRAAVTARRAHVAEQRRRHQLAGTAVDFREGERMRDPRRLAVYFTKHGSFAAKEYQNQVPKEWAEPGAGPGRFWGYWGLESAAVAVEVDPAVAVWAARILRRYARAAGTTEVIRGAGGVAVAEVRVRTTRQVTRPRVNTKSGAVSYRTYRVPVTRLSGGRGFLCVNDGPGLAGQLARAIDRLEVQPVAPPVRGVDGAGSGPAGPVCRTCAGPLDPRLAAANGRHLGC